MKISPARTAAFDILLRVENERAYTSVLLPAYEDKLSPADRGLCHELVLGTLRRKVWLDRVTDKLTGDKKLDLEVRIALRLGIYQLQVLDKIPQHAAINESVNLVQRAKKTSAKALVNAILRRASREIPHLTFSDDIDRIVVETSHPRWLIEKWVIDFGLDAAEAISIANNKIGGTGFRVIDTDEPMLAELLGAARVSELVDGCYIVSKPTLHPAIYFQDEASQMVAQSVTVPDGGRFIDVCAGPGGKTGLIASRHPAAVIAAGDLYRPRVEFLRENLTRQHVETVYVVQYDAETAMPFADEAFDTVLVDAPCSGTGTIRHNPEIRYFLEPTDITELALKQLRILTSASKLVKPAGLLTYSTCSLEKEENEAVCERFRAANAAFQPVRPRVNERFMTGDGFARTFPHRDDMDGFFIGCFTRASS